MTRPIGYYVHHHGDGHRQRALALARVASDRVVLLGTGLKGKTGSIAALDLPDDRVPGQIDFDGIDGTMSRPLALHYAPLNNQGVRARMGMISQWIGDVRPGLIVVDVSVEVAILARLCSTPVAFVRLSGRRNDLAHQEAFRAAMLVISPFARQLDDDGLPDWVRKKTVYCPGIVAARNGASEVIADRVLVVAGKGGPPVDGARLNEAAAMTPGKYWRVIGPAASSFNRNNLEFVGWVDDAAREVACAETVIGAAGDGLVNEVIAAARPFVCMPQPRPFDEQVQKARALKAAGAAVVLDEWPEPANWPAILDTAMHLNPDNLRALGDPDGAAKTMAILTSFADRQK